MIAKEPYIDLSTLDFNNVIADREEINKYNEQRFEMQQLDGILYQNEEYSIVKSNTKYGLNVYDLIVLEADAVSDNEFIYE